MTNPDNDAAVKESKSTSKPTRRKAAKKSTKKSTASDDNGSDNSKALKADSKKSARGRKPKINSQTDANGPASGEVSKSTATKKLARKSSTKKAKKSAAKKKEETNLTATNGNADADGQTTNRAPISSAPEDIIDVGSATPDARKSGWWSRSE